MVQERVILVSSTFVKYRHFYSINMEPTWLVLSCDSCARLFGKHKSAKNLACPHCNQSESKLISRHFDAQTARDAISMANVPPEIRAKLSEMISSEKSKNLDKNRNLDGQSVLSIAADDDGVITLESIQSALVDLRSNMDAEAFAEHASAEGQIIMLGPNVWKRA